MAVTLAVLKSLEAVLLCDGRALAPGAPDEARGSEPAAERGLGDDVLFGVVVDGERFRDIVAVLPEALAVEAVDAVGEFDGARADCGWLRVVAGVRVDEASAGAPDSAHLNVAERVAEARVEKSCGVPSADAVDFEAHVEHSLPFDLFVDAVSATTSDETSRRREVKSSQSTNTLQQCT